MRVFGPGVNIMLVLLTLIIKTYQIIPKSARAFASERVCFQTNAAKCGVSCKAAAEGEKWSGETLDAFVRSSV